MDTQEQIIELRDVEDDTYEGFMSPKQCGEIADTMERLTARNDLLEVVLEAAIHVKKHVKTPSGAIEQGVMRSLDSAITAAQAEQNDG